VNSNRIEDRSGRSPDEIHRKIRIIPVTAIL
jgi:hypothetical protein